MVVLVTACEVVVVVAKLSKDANVVSLRAWRSS
jgi:hypothetical protein